MVVDVQRRRYTGARAAAAAAAVAVEVREQQQILEEVELSVLIVYQDASTPL